MTDRPARLRLLAAFAAVYLIWGSTYLGIRFAIESIPPLLMAGSRFVLAGSVFLLLGRAQGMQPPTRREWRSAALVGLLLVGVGNGGVSWAEQTVPTSTAALVASAIPLWMTLIDWARPGGVRPSASTIGGIVLATVGLLVLIGFDGGGAALVRPDAGMVVLVLATVGWAFGSVVASHLPLPNSPIVATGAQMTVGGGVLLVAGVLAGEVSSFDAGGITKKSLMAWGYLVVFGSWIGFTAYIWLLRNTTPARVSTYAFVNPVVAVILGVWLASEVLDGRSLLAMAIILTGVAITVMNFDRRRPAGRSADVGVAAAVIPPSSSDISSTTISPDDSHDDARLDKPTL